VRKTLALGDTALSILKDGREHWLEVTVQHVGRNTRAVLIKDLKEVAEPFEIEFLK
jgi:hypothetical protein